MENLATLIRNQLEHIPAHIRTYIESDAYPRVMQSVVAQYNLHIDVASQVEIETTLLLIGLIKPSEYVANIKAAGLTDDQAKEIAAHMNREVFMPLVDAYKNKKQEFSNPLSDEPAIVQSEQPQQEAEVAPEPPQPPQEEKTIQKKYAIDPYREPIE